jgi:hypothetical protein
MTYTQKEDVANIVPDVRFYAMCPTWECAGEVY